MTSLWKDRALRLKAGSAKLLSFAWRRGGRAAWVVVGACVVLSLVVRRRHLQRTATSIVMLLPLLMEIEREGSVIDLEKLQIKDLKAQGFSEQQIQQMGLTQAVEPSVGLNAPSPPLPLPMS